MTAAGRARPSGRPAGSMPRRARPAATGVGTMLVVVLALALAAAPATAGVEIRPAAPDTTDAGGAGSSLTARWPLLIDASQRAAVGAAVERTLDLPRRGLLVALPAPSRPRIAPVPEADPRPRDLTMFGRRQTDGG